MITTILIIIIAILFIIILVKDNQLKKRLMLPENNLINIRYNKFIATPTEVSEVEQQISEKGYWSSNYEWKLSTNTECLIEPKTSSSGVDYHVTVKCEHEIRFTAASIERAIIFRKIYECLQQELYIGLGWSGWKTKDTFR